MKKFLYNPTDAPVVIDDDGRTVGGGEWTVGDSTTEQVKAALDGGSLVVADPPGDEASPAAKKAYEPLQAKSTPKKENP